MTKKHLHIAIDGPVGSGKSDISMRLARELNMTFLYTGAMYRALALLCQEQHVNRKDSAKVLGILRAHDIDFGNPPRGGKTPYSILIDGKDMTDRLFTPEMDQGASDVGTIPEVRRYMVSRQKKAAEGRSVVMEGRDIGLRVLPDADLKIYLTASLEERARRRMQQYEKKGKTISFEQMLEDTKKRDVQDSTRAADPLQKLPDAWELDTTGMLQDDVIRAIIRQLKERNLL